MRSDRWQLVFCLVGLIAWPTLHAHADVPLRLVLRVASDADRALVPRLRGQLSDTSAQLIVVEAAPLEAAFADQLARAQSLASEHEADALVWCSSLRSSPEQSLQILLTRSDRILTRPLANPAHGPLDSSQLETAALLVRSAVLALAQDAKLGQPTQELIAAKSGGPSESQTPHATPASASAPPTAAPSYEASPNDAALKAGSPRDVASRSAAPSDPSSNGEARSEALSGAGASREGVAQVVSHREGGSRNPTSSAPEAASPSDSAPPEARGEGVSGAGASREGVAQIASRGEGVARGGATLPGWLRDGVSRAVPPRGEVARAGVTGAEAVHGRVGAGAMDEGDAVVRLGVGAAVGGVDAAAPDRADGSRTAPDALRVRLALGAQLAVDGQSRGGQRGLFASAGLGFGRWAVSAFGVASLASELADEYFALNVARHALGVAVERQLPLSDAWSLGFAAHAGAVLLRRTSLAKSSAVVSYPASLVAALAFGPELALSFLPGRFGVALRMGIDVLPNAPRFESAGSLLAHAHSLWSVQPRVALGWEAALP